MTVRVKLTPKKRPLVLVLWEDVETYCGWLEDIEDIVEPPSFTTVGYLIRRTPDILITDTLERTGNLTVFPKKIVKKLVYIDNALPKKKAPQKEVPKVELGGKK